MVLKERLLEYVRKEHVAKVGRKLNEAENFFKHADRDPDQLLSFNPGMSELLLWDCCMKYHQLSGEYTLHTNAFFAYFTFKEPDLLIWPEPLQLFMRVLMHEGKQCVENVSKQEFFQLFITSGQHAD